MPLVILAKYIPLEDFSSIRENDKLVASSLHTTMRIDWTFDWTWWSNDQNVLKWKLSKSANRSPFIS